MKGKVRVLPKKLEVHALVFLTMFCWVDFSASEKALATRFGNAEVVLGVCTRSLVQDVKVAW